MISCSGTSDCTNGSVEVLCFTVSRKRGKVRASLPTTKPISIFIDLFCLGRCNPTKNKEYDFVFALPNPPAGRT